MEENEMSDLKNLAAIIDCWARLQEEVQAKREAAERLLDGVVSETSKQRFQREIYALEYIERKIEQLANVEGITREGVKWFENKNRQTGSDNDKAVEIGETTVG